jgi:hypothetical protein
MKKQLDSIQAPDLIKYVAYIGEKLKDCETKNRGYHFKDCKRANKRIVDVKIFKNMPNPFFQLDDGDLICVNMFIGL